MANIHTLLEAVVEAAPLGKKIKVEVADRNEYETIRTRLVTLWSEHRTIVLAIDGDDPLCELALCSDYQQEPCCGFYYLGKPRRKVAKTYSFTIVSPDATSDTPESGELADEESPSLQLRYSKAAK